MRNCATFCNDIKMNNDNKNACEEIIMYFDDKDNFFITKNDNIISIKITEIKEFCNTIYDTLENYKNISHDNIY